MDSEWRYHEKVSVGGGERACCHWPAGESDVLVTHSLNVIFAVWLIILMIGTIIFFASFVRSERLWRGRLRSTMERYETQTLELRLIAEEYRAKIEKLADHSREH